MANNERRGASSNSQRSHRKLHFCWGCEIANNPLIGLETKNKLTIRAYRRRNSKKADLTVSDDEEFNNALNDIEETLL